MPELPEVETMVRGIRPHITNRKIRNFIACPNQCKPIAIVPEFRLLQRRLIDKEFTDVRRLGKRVVLNLSDGSNIVIEPRMTGLMVLADPPDLGHLRLQWDFSGKSDYESLWFWDRRGLGTVTLFEPGQLESHFGSCVLGTDALEMTAEAWLDRLQKTEREIKIVLLDQRVVAGIGNLYASEILHVAGINPATAANRVSKKSIQRLDRAVQSVLRTAIENEGSTLGDGTYRNALNQNGRYQNHHRVYMREGMPCQACHRAKVIRFVQAQRSTFWCSQCQKG